ncbi:ArsC family reductase [Denitratisoma sp. DHT3]|uniref:ArsC family reductase n=1 Tax=Denitratisoma sp. DHT3 TaxID=1981880 RepID=UPI0011988144|nr:ArsC family reductase [Denitratisoma sp. DHT3]QDX80640.1 ArsC family reductase [Denitratisoma sp. DHT3]
MSVTLYGIKNCSTMKKALDWCEERGIPHAFHDYKKLGVPRERLVAWCQAVGWKTLVNTKGTTWRKLSPEQQDIATQSEAVALMLEHPSLIKRPVVETDSQLLVGFDPALFADFVK